jgi:hypothetical protein
MLLPNIPSLQFNPLPTSRSLFRRTVIRNAVETYLQGQILHRDPLCDSLKHESLAPQLVLDTRHGASHPRGGRSKEAGMAQP